MKIVLEGVTKIYKDSGLTTQALENITITFNKGERTVILGSSGAGKSTLLNIIGLIDSKYQGILSFDNNHIKSLSDKRKSQLRNDTFGYIFQEYALIESDSVYENVRIPLLYSRIKKAKHRSLIMEALELVELNSLASKRVKHLSGGQRQRVAIARALVHQPLYLLADEPTGSLDPDLTNHVMDILDDYLSADRSLIMVTHDQNLVSNFFDRIIIIDDGIIVEDKFNT